VVEDTLKAMERVGVAARARSKAKIVAVTGSVGKTTAKEMLRAMLTACGPTHASAASYNNHWGVPLTLARMPANVHFGVFEMGMNHAGEITPLTRLVRPHVAIVTTVEPVHLEFFSSVAAIADAKAEIFLGLEPGQITLHSHMLAVLDQYRHLDLGSRLKQAQRERAMAMGIHEMTWTYDPLQSRNAHFNFAKLGVVSDTYKVDFYGPETSSMLHRNGTDRLWVRWMLDSRRVQGRLVQDRVADKSANARAETLDALKLLAPLIRFDPSGKPARADLAESLSRQRLSIEIPGDILEVERADMPLANQWRSATRWAFTEALQAGFLVTDFCRSIRGNQGPGSYLLQRATTTELTL